jgi:hypothetical protein
MGHGQNNNRWFLLAQELAETGRYRNVAEVEAALRAREPDAALPPGKVIRGVIDGTCFRVRREKGWQT